MEARYRRPEIEGRTWRHGTLVSPYNDDIKDRDEVTILSNRTGGIYVIRREHVQVRIKGPRGGLKWQPL